MNRTTLSDSPFARNSPFADCVFFTLNKTRDRTIYTRAEQQASAKLNSVVKRLKQPKQNWYITGTKLLNGKVTDGLYPDFIFIGGMLSGYRFQLLDLNPVQSVSLIQNEDSNLVKEDRTEEFKNVDQIQTQTRKIMQPDVFICHICKTVGSWHDTISCPCRFV